MDFSSNVALVFESAPKVNDFTYTELNTRVHFITNICTHIQNWDRAVDGVHRKEGWSATKIMART